MKTITQATILQICDLLGIDDPEDVIEILITTSEVQVVSRHGAIIEKNVQP